MHPEVVLVLVLEQSVQLHEFVGHLQGGLFKALAPDFQLMALPVKGLEIFLTDRVRGLFLLDQLEFMNGVL